MNVRVVQIITGLVCTIFFLALALYRVQLGSVGSALAHANPSWIGAAIVAYAVNLSLRTRRWQIILRPVAAIPYQVVGRALLVGYGLNTIMPARLGELFRAEFFKKSFGLSRVWALTSIVIERLFDGLTVVSCLGLGLLLTATTRQGAGIVINVLAMGGALFGAALLAAFCLSGSTMSRILSRFPGVSAQLGMVQSGFGILRTWRTLEIAILTLIIYIPDALSLWFLVKAVGLSLGFADTLVLVGLASLSTLVPSGPAFLGTLQFAYALAIEFAGGSRAVGIAAATLAQLWLLLPIALVATGLLVHGSGRLLSSMLKGRGSDVEATRPEANEAAGR
jgi:glycosyltransferase 2 family protein